MLRDSHINASVFKICSEVLPFSNEKENETQEINCSPGQNNTALLDSDTLKVYFCINHIEKRLTV